MHEHAAISTAKHLRLAVVGAGPVGLTLGLLAARLLPHAEVTLFDARPADKDVSADPRALALAQGSVLLLQRLGVWPQGHLPPQAQAITEVHVSQAPPTLGSDLLVPEVRLSASELKAPQLGAVLHYGQLVAPLQRAWEALQRANAPRLRSAFGTAVNALNPVPGGVQVDTHISESFDLAVVAEGGVFGEQAHKALRHDYGQTAWVGVATLQGATAGRAIERFTRHGPVALLPLPTNGEPHARAALVWCVPTTDDPVRGLTAAQRVSVLNTLLPEQAGTVLGLSELKPFELGLNAQATLVQGRSVRIGNAAQTLHPVAGQGLNLGLRDAYALVQALREHADVEAALRRIEWARGPDRWAMMAATDFLARSFTWSWPGLPALRGLGLAALQGLPFARRALARQMMFGTR